ncbi:MFS transporter [Oxalobacteraceae bacterium OM1]|nr:MFS transporter [Oxalobacteraceae bacterium OM1]
MSHRAPGRLAELGDTFRYLLISDLLMLLAIMVGQVAIPWWIVHRGSAHDLAVYAGVLAATSFVALPLLSPLGDRVSKRTLIAGGLACHLAGSCAVAVLVQHDIFQLPLVIAFQMINVIAMAAVMPASLSIVAEVLPPERITAGLGMQKSAQAIGRLIGPALGGAILAASSSAVALWLHVILLAVACVCAGRIVAPGKTGAAGNSRWLADLRAGLAAKWKIPMERGWTFVSFLVMIFFTPAIGMLVPLKVQSLHLSGAWFGACEAGLSAGLLLGALGGSVRLANAVGRFRASFGAILCEGLCLIVLGLTHTPVVMVGAFVLFGACISTVQMVGQTHRMLAMPPDFRARMMAVNMMVMQVAGVLGPGIAGAALAGTGIDAVYFCFGIALCAVGLGYPLVPGYRSFLGMSHDEAKGLYARTHPRLFRSR